MWISIRANQTLWEGLGGYRDELTIMSPFLAKRLQCKWESGDTDWDRGGDFRQEAESELLK